MNQKPDIFAVDATKQYKQYQEKKYCYLIGDNIPEKYSILTKTSYFINPPKSEYGNVHVIKKETIYHDIKTETTLAMVYGEKLADTLLKKCIESKV